MGAKRPGNINVGFGGDSSYGGKMSRAKRSQTWAFVVAGLCVGCDSSKVGTPEGDTDDEIQEVDMSTGTETADCGLPSTVLPMVEVPTLATSEDGIAIRSAYSNHGEAAFMFVALDTFDPEAKHSVQRWTADEVIWEVEVPRELFAVGIDDGSGNTWVVGGTPIGVTVYDLSGEIVHEAALPELEGSVEAVAVQGNSVFLAGKDDSRLWVAHVLDFAVDWVVPALDPKIQGTVGLAVSEGIVLVGYTGQGVALHANDGTQAWPFAAANGVMTARSDGGFLVAGYPAEVIALDLDGTRAWTTPVSSEPSSEVTAIQVHGDAVWLSVIPWTPHLGWGDAPVDLGAAKLDGTACAAVPVSDVYQGHSPHVMIVGEDDSAVLVGIGCPNGGIWCGLFSTRVI
jgi:outer membrane protein assembly factor BamB